MAGAATVASRNNFWCGAEQGFESTARRDKSLSLWCATRAAPLWMAP